MTTKFYKILFLVVFSLAVLVALGTYVLPRFYGRNTEKLVVVSTVYPISDLIKNIGGDRIKLLTLVPDNLSPHLFVMPERKVALLEDADLIFRVGYGLEPWLNNPIAGLQNKSKVITLSDGIQPILPKKKDGGNVRVSQNSTLEPTDDIVVDEYATRPQRSQPMPDFNAAETITANPHTWLDPINAIHMCEIITNTLSDYDPDNRDYYEANFLKYQVDLRKLHLDIIQTINQYSHRRYLPLHNAWDYFDRRYVTEKIVTLEDPLGTPPGISREKAIYDAIELNNVKVIYAEPQVDAAPIRKIAQQTKVRLDFLDPLGSHRAKDRNTYLKMMYYNLSRMKQAFY